MRVLVQRVKEASVKSGDYYGSVQKGCCYLSVFMKRALNVMQMYWQIKL